MKTHNALPKLQDRAIGSRFVGYVDSTYDDLVRIFGKPIECEFGDDQKTDVEWFIEFDAGLLAMIYNYKNGPNYLDSQGTPATKSNAGMSEHGNLKFSEQSRLYCIVSRWSPSQAASRRLPAA